MDVQNKKVKKPTEEYVNLRLQRVHEMMVTNPYYNKLRFLRAISYNLKM